MLDSVAAPVMNNRFRQVEFYVFTIIAFAAKSLLLIRLPYRPWQENALYTGLLLLLLYCFFRFRQSVNFPPFVLFCLAAAVGVDVMGNLFGFYGQPFGPLPDYDEFAHFFGSGFSLVPAMWLLRTTTRRMGFKLPQNLLAFLSVTVTFSFCGWYEILELWDELFYGGRRIWTYQDTANDLQFDLAGVVAFALVSSLIFKLIDKRAERASDEPPSL
ncbi:MAG TPA: hypothetical protein VJZ26_07945 [Blastocatellia bacterium]|nr:hypothetical protein [Blastocatellia bacterium]